MKYRFEALAYDLVGFSLRLFPFAWISGLGAIFVKIIGPLTSKHRIAETGLRTAFPEKTDAEIKQLLKQQWANTGRTLAEFPLTHRLKPFSKNSRVEVVGLELFEHHAPAVIVTGHFANWEVMATVLTQSEQPVRITYRKINNCLLYTSPSPRDRQKSRMPSSA